LFGVNWLIIKRRVLAIASPETVVNPAGDVGGEREDRPAEAGAEEANAGDAAEPAVAGAEENPAAITPVGRPADGRARLSDFDRRDQDMDEDTVAQRKQIKEIEKIAGRELTAEERQLIINTRLGDLTGIDKATNNLLERYSKKLNETAKSAKFKKYGLKIGTFLASATASTLLRTALHSVGGIVGIGAGTITGAVVGGTLGGIQASSAELSKQYSADSLVSEYQRIKDDETNETRVADAITFLHKAIETQTFRGNAGDLLKLVVFYRRELGANVAEEDMQDTLDRLEYGANGSENPRNIPEAAHRYELLDEFRTSVRGACKKEGLKGMWRGAVIGGGIGLVSDIVSHFVEVHRFAEAKDAYIKAHYGYNNEFHPHYDPSVASAPDIPVDSHFQGLNGGTGLNLEATPYGNTLAKAMEDGIRTGELHVPDNYITKMIEDGAAQGINVTKQDAIGQFIHNFNFTQLPHPGDWWSHGSPIDFNKDGVQELMNQVMQGGYWDEAKHVWVGGEVNFQQFADTLKNGGRILYEQFPTQMQILTGQPNELMNRALGEAARASAESFGQGAVHGAVIGAKAAGAIEVLGYKEGKSDQSQAAEVAGGGGDGGGDAEAEGRREERRGGAEPAAGAGAEAGAGGAPAEAAPPEETPPEEEPPEIYDWQDLFSGNRDLFRARAQAILIPARDKGWEDMTEPQRKNIINFFDFVKTYNEQGLRYRVRFKIGSTMFNLADAPTSDLHIAQFRTLSGIDPVEERNVDLNSADNFMTVVIAERDSDTVGETFGLDAFPDEEGRFDLKAIPALFRLHRAMNGAEATAEIVKKRDRASVTPLFAGDEFPNSKWEIIGVVPEDREMIIRNSYVRRKDSKQIVETRRLKEADFRNIDNIKIKIWRPGGGTDDGQYNRGR